jgi:hypothetical protein
MRDSRLLHIIIKLRRWWFQSNLSVMPPGARRVAREKALLKAYVRHNKGRQRRIILRRRAAARLHQETRLGNPRHLDLDDLSSLSSATSSDSDSDETSSGDDWSDILDPNWRFGSDILDELSDITGLTSSSHLSSDSDDPMPDLHSVGSSSTSDSEWAYSNGADGDDEESSEDDSEDDAHRPPFLRRLVMEEIDKMYERRYETPRNTLPRGPSYLHHVLNALKSRTG